MELWKSKATVRRWLTSIMKTITSLEKTFPENKAIRTIVQIILAGWKMGYLIGNTTGTDDPVKRTPRDPKAPARDPSADCRMNPQEADKLRHVPQEQLFDLQEKLKHIERKAFDADEGHKLELLHFRAAVSKIFSENPVQRRQFDDQLASELNAALKSMRESLEDCASAR